MSRNKPPRKAYRPRPVALNNLQLAQAGAALLTAKEVAAILRPVHEAVAAMRSGTATRKNYELISGQIDVAKCIEQLRVVRGLVGVLQVAAVALSAIEARAYRSKVWTAPTLYASEIIALDEFARLHNWQVSQLSWTEYKAATIRATGQITSAGNTVTAYFPPLMAD